MRRVLTIAIAILTLGFSGDDVRRQNSIDCDDPAAVNEALFFSPWPPILVSAPGGPMRMEISERGTMTEGQVLAYFAAFDRALPTVTTEVRYDDHTIDEFVRIHRSWVYAGLEIAGQVTERGGLYYERITLETKKYPLVCEIRIGQPLSMLSQRIGASEERAAAGAAGVAVFTRPEERAGTAHYALRAFYDQEGKIVRLEWSLPVGH